MVTSTGISANWICIPMLPVAREELDRSVLMVKMAERRMSDHDVFDGRGNGRAIRTQAGGHCLCCDGVVSAGRLSGYKHGRGRHPCPRLKTDGLQTVLQQGGPVRRDRDEYD